MTQNHPFLLLGTVGANVLKLTIDLDQIGVGIKGAGGHLPAIHPRLSFPLFVLIAALLKLQFLVLLTGGNAPGRVNVRSPGTRTVRVEQIP